MTSKYWIPFSKAMGKSEKMYYDSINGGLDKQLRVVAEWLGSQECLDAYVLNRKKLEKYLKESELHKDLNKIIQANVDNCEEYIQEFYKQGAAKGCKDIQQTLRFTQADKEALFHLKKYNFELIKSINEDLKNGIRSTLTEGILAGADTRELGAQINNLSIEPLGNISPRARANMIARTEYSRAMNTGNLQSYANYGISTVEVITAGDNYVCDLCIDMEEKNPYPVDYEDLPPFHPNCRCAVAPVTSLSPYTAEPVANPPVINQIPTEENNKEGYDFNNNKLLSPEELEDMSFEDIAKYHNAEYKGLFKYKYDGKEYHLFHQEYGQGRYMEIYVEKGAVKGYKSVPINEIINEVFKIPASMKRETDSIWFKNTQQGITKRPTTKSGYDSLGKKYLGYNTKNNAEWYQRRGSQKVMIDGEIVGQNITVEEEGVGHNIVINPIFFKKGYWDKKDNVDFNWKRSIHHEFGHSLDVTRDSFEKDVEYWKSDKKNGELDNKMTQNPEWRKIFLKHFRKGFTQYANRSDEECYAEHMGYVSFMESNPEWQKKGLISIYKSKEEITYEEYKKRYHDMYEFCMKQIKGGK